MNDLDAQLQALARDLAAQTGEPEAPADAMATVAEVIRRLGTQQMRTAQAIEAGQETLREQFDAVRRERNALLDRAKAEREAILTWLDGMDDAVVLARQSGDDRLIAWLQRLHEGADRLVQRFGLAEVAVKPGVQFDEATCDPLDTVQASGQTRGTVVEVVRRGFYYEGAVFRRAQVTVAGGEA